MQPGERSERSSRRMTATLEQSEWSSRRMTATLEQSEWSSRRMTAARRSREATFPIHTIDHAIPKSVGGNNTIANAQNTCRTCNLQKGAMSTSGYLNQISSNQQSALQSALNNLVQILKSLLK